MALMLSHWSKISHAIIFNFRENRKTTCHWMETPECFGLNRLDSLFCLASCTSQRCPEHDPRRRLWTSLSFYCSLLLERWSPERNRNRVSVRPTGMRKIHFEGEPGHPLDLPLQTDAFGCMSLLKTFVLLLYILEMHNLLMISIICLRSICTDILAQKSFQTLEWCMFEAIHYTNDLGYKSVPFGRVPAHVSEHLTECVCVCRHVCFSNHMSAFVPAAAIVLSLMS